MKEIEKNKQSKATPTNATPDVPNKSPGETKPGGLAALDPAAIAEVQGQAWPAVRDLDELHDQLLSFGVLPRPTLERQHRTVSVGNWCAHTLRHHADVRCSHR